MHIMFDLTFEHSKNMFFEFPIVYGLKFNSNGL